MSDYLIAYDGDLIETRVETCFVDDDDGCGSPAHSGNSMTGHRRATVERHFADMTPARAKAILVEWVNELSEDAALAAIQAAVDRRHNW